MAVLLQAVRNVGCRYLPKLERVTTNRASALRDKVERIRTIARWSSHEQWFNLGMVHAHVAEADRPPSSPNAIWH